MNKATLLSACSSLFTWVTRVTKCFTDRMRDSARGSSRPNLATPTTTAWSGCTIKTLDDRDCARVPSPHSSYSSSPFQTLLSLLDSLCTLLLLSLFSDVPFSFLSCLLFFTHVVVLTPFFDILTRSGPKSQTPDPQLYSPSSIYPELLFEAEITRRKQ